MGTVYREYEDGLVECVGHKPDIECIGQDALQVALKDISGHSSPVHRLTTGALEGKHDPRREEALKEEDPTRSSILNERRKHKR